MGSEMCIRDRDIPALLKQTNENSIVSTAVFKKMQKMGGDIDAMLSPASLIGPYANMIKESDMPFNMKDLKMLGSLSFEKGKISMKYENFTESPELQALFDKQKKATCPIENTFLKYFPKSTLMYISAGITGTAPRRHWCSLVKILLHRSPANSYSTTGNRLSSALYPCRKYLIFSGIRFKHPPDTKESSLHLERKQMITVFRLQE